MLCYARHLVDSQSFPSCSAAFPKICEGAFPNGASQPAANVSKARYTPADLRGVVDYAKRRGVRIMPEWDMPGASTADRTRGLHS
jgi:hexosaminidase